jgi:hypothetical protein
MTFTTAELAEVRSAFRRRIKTEPRRKQPARPKSMRKPEPPRALVREPEYDDVAILSPAQVAELFAVTRAPSGAGPTRQYVRRRPRPLKIE